MNWKVMTVRKVIHNPELVREIKEAKRAILTLPYSSEQTVDVKEVRSTNGGLVIECEKGRNFMFTGKENSTIMVVN